MSIVDNHETMMEGEEREGGGGPEEEPAEAPPAADNSSDENKEDNQGIGNNDDEDNDDALYCMNAVNMEQQIMSPEEEEAWLGKYFSSRKNPQQQQLKQPNLQMVTKESSSSCDDNEEDPESPTLEQQMADLEKEFEDSMKLAAEAAAGTRGGQQKQEEVGNAALEQATTSAEELHATALGLATASVASTTPSCSSNVQQQQLQSAHAAVHKVYAELHNQADADIIMKLRMAMDCIPEGTSGLADCRHYFSTKQHYTLQDVLVAQYVLNDGLLMRQNHGMPDEYHVDIAEPLE